MSGLFTPQWFGGNGVFAPQFTASGGAFFANQVDALSLEVVQSLPSSLPAGLFTPQWFGGNGVFAPQFSSAIQSASVTQADSLALDSIQVSVLGVAFQVNQVDALNLIETLSAAAQGGVLMVNP